MSIVLVRRYFPSPNAPVHSLSQNIQALEIPKPMKYPQPNLVLPM
nr:MAG TPA: hypothetical protein [Caudoviricetes sp.]